MCCAAPLTDAGEIRRRLVEQVTGTVRWRECVACMAGQGVDRFYEVGAGKVLSGPRQADRRRRVEAVAIGTPDDVAAFAARP